MASSENLTRDPGSTFQDETKRELCLFTVTVDFPALSDETKMKPRGLLKQFWKMLYALKKCILIYEPGNKIGVVI